MWHLFPGVTPFILECEKQYVWLQSYVHHRDVLCVATVQSSEKIVAAEADGAFVVLVKLISSPQCRAICQTIVYGLHEGNEIGHVARLSNSFICTLSWNPPKLSDNHNQSKTWVNKIKE